MGTKCYCVHKAKRHSIEVNHSTTETASTTDTQGTIETEAKVIIPPKKAIEINYDKKPILRKLMERNKIKNKK